MSIKSVLTGKKDKAPKVVDLGAVKKVVAKKLKAAEKAENEK